MEMKPLVIYHANCADGFGAAFAAWLKFGEEAEYVPFKYNEGEMRFKTLFQLGDPKRDIYILDFSFPRELMDWLFSVAKRVVWLDHHKTAFEMWTGLYVKGGQWLEDDNNYIFLDDNKSGAVLAWEYFHPDKEVPLLIQHIDDYDRWQFKIEGTKEFNRALWSYAPWSFEQWDTFCLEDESCAEMLIDEGAAILRAHDQNVTAVVKGAARKCMLNLSDEPGFEPKGLTLYGLAANCPPHLASDVGHQLANQSGTYGLLWSVNKEGKCLCSLRSNGDYDVSAIAKALGGGGHKNAAGFEISVETLLEWIK
jgi:oligoribonuclease NrnB/cAMP/cGMP phosphodiesterase (DHH superfamily)